MERVAAVPRPNNGSRPTEPTAAVDLIYKHTLKHENARYIDRYGTQGTMPFIASYFASRGDELVRDIEVDPPDNVFPKVCDRGKCRTCYPPFTTISDRGLQLQSLTNNTFKSIGVKSDLRIHGFTRYRPIFYLLREECSQAFLEAQHHSPHSFSKSRAMTSLAIGTWIMSPQGTQQLCNAPGFSLSKDARTIHSLAALDQRSDDIVTQLLLLAYYTLVADEGRMTELVKALEPALYSEPQFDVHDLLLGNFSWTYHGFIYYLSNAQQTSIDDRLLYTLLDSNKAGDNDFYSSAVSFRTELFMLQMRQDFGHYAGASERATSLRQLKRLHHSIFTRTGDQDIMLSLPLLVEWHLTSLFSEWHLFEDLSAGNVRCQEERGAMLKALFEINQTLEVLLSESVQYIVRTPAVYFCQKHRKLWHRLLWLTGNWIRRYA